MFAKARLNEIINEEMDNVKELIRNLLQKKIQYEQYREDMKKQQIGSIVPSTTIDIGRVTSNFDLNVDALMDQAMYGNIKEVTQEVKAMLSGLEKELKQMDEATANQMIEKLYNLAVNLYAITKGKYTKDISAYVEKTKKGKSKEEFIKTQKRLQEVLEQEEDAAAVPELDIRDEIAPEINEKDAELEAQLDKIAYTNTPFEPKIISSQSNQIILVINMILKFIDKNSTIKYPKTIAEIPDKDISEARKYIKQKSEQIEEAFNQNKLIEVQENKLGEKEPIFTEWDIELNDFTPEDKHFIRFWAKQKYNVKPTAGRSGFYGRYAQNIINDYAESEFENPDDYKESILNKDQIEALERERQEQIRQREEREMDIIPKKAEKARKEKEAKEEYEAMSKIKSIDEREKIIAKKGFTKPIFIREILRFMPKKSDILDFYEAVTGEIPEIIQVGRGETISEDNFSEIYEDYLKSNYNTPLGYARFIARRPGYDVQNSKGEGLKKKGKGMKPMSKEKFMATFKDKELEKILKKKAKEKYPKLKRISDKLLKECFNEMYEDYKKTI